MNDPGLDVPIQDAEIATHPEQGEWAEEIEEEDLLLDPSRWWFASTASPLIAGTFGPMASAFNICALVEKWREHIPDGKTEDTGTSIQDPTWLLAVNGISLGFALIANASLLLNMVGRLRFEIAQPITIIGFYLAALLLIALVGVASTSLFELQPRSTHALTQAFYYACYAAGLYTIIGILMTLTVYGALKGKYPTRFEISNSQRTLMLQTISLMAYLLIGAAIYTALEGWYFLDAVFWADFTLLTIGLGSPLVPATHAGRSLIIPFTFGGILAVGLVIGSIRSMLLEKGAQKMHARATEKKRQQIIHLKDAEVGRSKFNWLRKKRRPKQRADTMNMPERSRRAEEFHAMRQIQEHAAKKQKWAALAMSTTNAAMLWFIGAVVFWYTEYKQDWTYFQSMYFSYTSLITLGYGDFQPESNSGKSFFVFWSLLAIPTLTVLISDMGDTVVKGIAEATNWLGSLTIAPGDKDFWQQVRQNIHVATGGLLFKSQKANRKKKKLIMHESKEQDDRIGKFPDLLFARLREDERRDIETYGRDKIRDEAERDNAFYQYLLVKEVRSVLADVRAKAAISYTYDEWAYFLMLLGHDEESEKLHSRQYNRPKKDDEDAPQVGRIVDHDGNAREWSWLSLRSPLMSQMSEPEWVLHRLLEQLHGEMHIKKHIRRRHSDDRGRESTVTGPPGDAKSQNNDRRPPVSISMFMKHAGVSKKAKRQAKEGHDEEEREKEAGPGAAKKKKDEEGEDVVAEGRGGPEGFLAAPPFTQRHGKEGEGSGGVGGDASQEQDEKEDAGEGEEVEQVGEEEEEEEEDEGAEREQNEEDFGNVQGMKIP